MQTELVLRAVMALLAVLFILAGLMFRNLRHSSGPRTENFLILKVIRNLFRAEKRASQK